MSAEVVKSTDNVEKIVTKGGLSLESAYTLTSDIITLMGMSFVLGVLFTTFILLILDFIRRNQPEE